MENVIVQPPIFNVESLRQNIIFLISSSLEITSSQAWSFEMWISSTHALECNSWFLFNLVSFISLFCKALLIFGIHLQRYVWFFLFHILLSNYASYIFSHIILSRRFLHLWKAMNWLNKCYYKKILRRYYHSSQVFMISMF